MSALSQGKQADLAAVSGAATEAVGVAHAAELVAFVDSVMGEDESERTRTRDALRRVVSPAAFVDACAVIGAFNVVDRVADATGIPLDDVLSEASREVRETLDLRRFASAANTPGIRDSRD